VIVDDHAMVRDGLRQILAARFPRAVFGEARDAREALEVLASQSWDVMLLDISMPGQSGVDVLKQIENLAPGLKVLVLSMHPEDQYAVRVLKAGAVGYITKDKASAVLVEAVNTVLAGGRYVSPALAQDLASRLSVPRDRAPHELLSDREYQILRMLGAGKSVKEIGHDLSLSIKTISTYRTRMMAKLNLKSNADVIRYVLTEKLID
jgi:DNA-binding NarL/FixJ family response regulator